MDVIRPPSVDDYADLGLGEGLRPGALPSKQQLLDLASEQAMILTTITNQRPSKGKTQTNKTQNCCKTEPDKYITPTSQTEKTGSRLLDKIRKIKSGRTTEISGLDKDEDKYSSAPFYADIALGTSIRQQRELFEQELSQMLGHQETVPHIAPVKAVQNGKVALVNIDKELLEKKLVKTKQEVEVLKHDLELCQEQLDAKYRAIKIMQGEAYAVHKEETVEANKVKLLNQRLREEINKLQFEMDCKETFLTNSQDTWAERFDRVCQENVALMSAMEEKNIEMKKIYAEKMAVCRERDELLALVDVQERQRFESLRSSCDDNNSADCYNTFTSIELAVLGACQCRGPRLEPCGCALSAAKLKQEITRLKAKISEQVKCLEEATITTDTYRVAFEEQLSRNRDLIKRFAEVTAAPRMSRAEKAKAAIKWLIKQLNEEEYDRNIQSQTTENGETNCHTEFRSDIEELFASIPEDLGEGMEGTNVVLNGKEDVGQLQEQSHVHDKHELQEKSDTELIDVLADMISDKSEALAHQRMTSKLLAKRNKELEQQLTSLTEGEEVFQNNSIQEERS